MWETEGPGEAGEALHLDLAREGKDKHVGDFLSEPR